ncbi:MAG: D-tyrosyl-tRNA(Tyr) deacylase [Abditibacteriota bacterium]|nr:D-tyrosyl-tRNA(Tyr) deacylase [Abditibacteriota bacterium]
MICVVQRTASSSVKVKGETVGRAGRGLNILVGIAKGDTEEMADRLSAKICGMRIFEDDKGKMNLSLRDVGGSVLVISQFTLLGNTSKGRRPSFENAEEPARARELYLYFADCFRNSGIHTETGVFGADMLVSIENDGPVTFVLTDSDRR